MKLQYVGAISPILIHDVPVYDKEGHLEQMGMSVSSGQLIDVPATVAARLLDKFNTVPGKPKFVEEGYIEKEDEKIQVIAAKTKDMKNSKVTKKDDLEL